MARRAYFTGMVAMAAAAVVFGACAGGDGSARQEGDPASTIVPAAASTSEASPVPTPTTGLPRSAEQRFPDVVDATVQLLESGRYRFDVTISSPYDTPERYADAWRISGPDGAVYGVRELLHHHANEQPFTRSLTDVEVPAGVTTVTIEGRDLVHGWGGGTLDVDLPDD